MAVTKPTGSQPTARVAAPGVGLRQAWPGAIRLVCYRPRQSGILEQQTLITGVNDGDLENHIVP